MVATWYFDGMDGKPPDITENDMPDIVAPQIQQLGQTSGRPARPLQRICSHALE